MCIPVINFQFIGRYHLCFRTAQRQRLDWSVAVPSQSVKAKHTGTGRHHRLDISL